MIGAYITGHIANLSVETEYASCNHNPPKHCSASGSGWSRRLLLHDHDHEICYDDQIVRHDDMVIVVRHDESLLL